MIELALAIGGLVVGAALAWAITQSRVRSRYEARLDEEERRAVDAEAKASGLQNMIDEFRSREQKAAEDFEKLRARLDTEQSARVKAETQLSETLERLKEERKLLDEAKEKLTETFKSLAGDTLDNTNKRFLQLARESFDKIMSDAHGDLGKRQEAIKGMVKPLSESLQNFESHVREIEKHRNEAYAGLTEQLKRLSQDQQTLQNETRNLVTALRSPKVVGAWGEMALRRVVELAGMTEYCDFTTQVSVSTAEGVRVRPDLIIHLPGDRKIVVDAKASFDAYQEAIEAETEELRQQRLNKHAANIRSHMKTLANKSYWQEFETAPEFVVMFIPGESFFAAALDADRRLLEDAMEKRVVPATPTTLLALLYTVAQGWRQEQITRNAQEISELGKQLYERMKVLADHVGDIGRGLEKANSSYNSAVGSLEARVLPSARRFKELGVTSGDAEITPIPPIETTPRSLTAPELLTDDDDNGES